MKKGWCSGTEKLTRIIISPFNGQFIFKEDKYLIGKSNQNNDEFNQFLFVQNNIKEISILPSVTKICECAFSNCNNLGKVEIPKNSNLQTIEKNAFMFSNIEEISIPHGVAKIYESAFSYYQNLRKVEIPTDSNLQTIEKYAFLFSKIDF